MKRELTKGEQEVAQLMADVIGGLDNLVFPDNPIPKIFIVRQESDTRGNKVGYISKEDAAPCGNPEHYVIHGYGIDKWVENEGKQRIILMKESEGLSYEELPLLTLEELLLGIAAHEVRHRLQHCSEIRWFTPECVESIEDIYLKGHIEFRESVFKHEPPKGDRDREFDAEVIEFLIREEYHWGERNPSKIAQLIKLEPPPKAEGQ